MGRRLQVAMDRVTVAPGVFGGERLRFFRRSIDSPGWEEHLAIRSPHVPTLEVGVPSEVVVETLAGPLTVGILVVHQAPADAPLIVTHHGNSERAFDLGRRSKNFLNKALLAGDRPDATLVLLRAPFHDGPLRAYAAACRPAGHRRPGRRPAPDPGGRVPLSWLSNRRVAHACIEAATGVDVVDIAAVPDGNHAGFERQAGAASTAWSSASTSSFGARPFTR